MERDSRAIPWMLDTDDEHYASDVIQSASDAHKLLPLVSHRPTLISRGRVGAKRRGFLSSSRAFRAFRKKRRARKSRNPARAELEARVGVR